MLPGTVVYPVAILIAVVVVWRGVARGLPAARIAAQAVLVLYLGWMIGATLFPIPLDGESPVEELLSRLNAPNIIPFHTIRETLALVGVWTRVRLLAGNVVVFMPFGLLVPLVWPRLARLGRMALAGLLFSGGIELSQLAVSLVLGFWYRMPDVDDVLLNVPGVVLGFGCLLLLRSLRQEAARRETAAREPASRERAGD